MVFGRWISVSALSVCVAGTAMGQQKTPVGKAAAEDGPSGQNPVQVQGANQPQQGQVQQQPAGQRPQAGQVQTRPGQANPQGQVAQNAQWQDKNQQLAECVATDNQGEVAIAKYAMDKLQHEDAKKFAKMLVEEHQAFLVKLDKFAPNSSQEPNWLKSTGDADDRTTSTAAQDNRTVKIAAPAGGQRTTAFRGEGQAAEAVDHEQIHREIAQECLASSKKMLDEKEGQEIDQCFVGMQIAKHAYMKDMLTVLERHASGDLAQVLAEGRESTEKHMKHAIALMEKLDKGSDKQADAKGERQNRRDERREDKNN